MKTLELNQMERLQGGDIESCAGFGVGAAISTAVLLAFVVGTGGGGLIALGIFGASSYSGAMAYGTCLFVN